MVTSTALPAYSRLSPLAAFVFAFSFGNSGIGRRSVITPRPFSRIGHQDVDPAKLLVPHGALCPAVSGWGFGARLVSGESDAAPDPVVVAVYLVEASCVLLVFSAGQLTIHLFFELVVRPVLRQNFSEILLHRIAAVSRHHFNEHSLCKFSTIFVHKLVG